MSRRFFVTFCAGIVLAANAHAVSPALALPEPHDLRADAVRAQRERKPIVILFSLPGCAFCQVVRQNYLAPLLRDLAPNERPIIREVEITSTRTLAGFNGAPLSQHDLAKRLNVRFAPTVLFLDSSGQLLAPPIIGGDTVGLYGGYLDNAFAEAAQKLSRPK
jgi:thioredoxin-related protein